MMSTLVRCFALIIVLGLGGCAYMPRPVGADPKAPKPLPEELMQTQPLVVWEIPPREAITGCVAVSYDITRKGVPQNVKIIESHPPGYFDAEVLRLMEEIRFKARAKTERGARVFGFVPPNSPYTREAAASVCSPAPTHEELNRKDAP